MPRDDHRLLGYDQQGGRFAVRCSCGWRSRTASSAGVAGTYWDQHHAEAIAVADARHPA